MSSQLTILGIETSCDETAAAVVVRDAAGKGDILGEVVLSHSLIYRVEQLFLIHRETGLLIAHETSAGVRVQSPEMVSGMLTAITEAAGALSGARVAG